MDPILSDNGKSSTLVTANHDRKKPRQPRTLHSQPRTILEEDEYTSTLSHIVTRDYYPALHTLRRDAAILDARRRGNISEAVSIRRKFRTEQMQREREWMEEIQEEEGAVTTRPTNDDDNDDNNNIDSNEGNKYESIHSRKIIGQLLRKRPRPIKHESITGFHARVTSEDNAEFELNQERERREREEFLSQVYGARADKAGRLMIENQIGSRNETGDGNTGDDRLLRCGNNYSTTLSKNPYSRALCDTPLGLSSDLFDAPPSAGLRITDGSCNRETAARNGIGRNGLFFQPLHHDSISINHEKISGGDAKLASVSSGKFLALEKNDISTMTLQDKESNITNPENPLMLPPPSRLPSSSSSSLAFHQLIKHESKMQSTPSIDHRHHLIEYLPKPTLPDIHPPATRFPYQNESRLLPNVNISSSRTTSDSNGSFSTDASDTTDLDESPRPLHMERASYNRARMRENETFLPMTPLIRPGRGEENIGIVDRTLPQTVGSEAALGCSGASSSWEPSFDVVDENIREKIARKAEKRMVERSKEYRSAGSSKRVRGYNEEEDEYSVMSSRSRSSSTYPINRVSSFTPAARDLLQASNAARKASKLSKLLKNSHGIQPSRIFSSSSIVSGKSAGSKDSFASSLRMSYTPNVTNWNKKSGKTTADQSTSSLRLASGGATPR